MVNPARILVRREAGGLHGNVSTPTPPLQHQDGTTPSSGSSSNTVVIVTGVVVPLVIIGIGALIFYIWYRKKYPVRMVVGKDFGKFSNPAYSKRNSTLTLVKEDGQNYWDTFQPSGISNPGLSLVIEDEEDGAHGFQPQNIETVDETDAAAKMENIEKMMHSGSIVIENGNEHETNEEKQVAIVKADITNASQKSETPNEEQKETKEEKPRKALLVHSESGTDASFEIVTESDIDHQTNSDSSSTNDSTGTHTVMISENESSEADYASGGPSEKSADYDQESLKNNTESPKIKNLNTEVESNVTEEFEILPCEIPNTEGEENQAKDSYETEIDTHGNKDEGDEESSSKLEMPKNYKDTHVNDEGQSISNTNLVKSESSSHASQEIDYDKDIDDLSVNQKDTKESTDEDSSLEHIEFRSDDDERKVKIPDHILLESHPKTPTMIVQDSIIFESESVSPVLFASVQETPVRQRRAHTIECVMPGGLTRLDESNMATKEWYSFDDIDKMDTSSTGIGLFEPIRKQTQNVESDGSDQNIMLEKSYTAQQDNNADKITPIELNTNIPILESDVNRTISNEIDTNKASLDTNTTENISNEQDTNKSLLYINANENVSSELDTNITMLETETTINLSHELGSNNIQSFEKVDVDNGAILMNEPMVTSSDASFSFEILPNSEDGNTTSITHQVNTINTNEQLIPVSNVFGGNKVSISDATEESLVRSEHDEIKHFVDTPETDNQFSMLDSDPSIEVINSMNDSQVDENSIAISPNALEKDNVMTDIAEQNLKNDDFDIVPVSYENDFSKIQLVETSTVEVNDKNDSLNLIIEQDIDLVKHKEIKGLEKDSEYVTFGDAIEKDKPMFDFGENDKENVDLKNNDMKFNESPGSKSFYPDKTQENILDFENDLVNKSMSDLEASSSDNTTLLNFENNTLPMQNVKDDKDTKTDDNEESLVVLPDIVENKNKQVIKPQGFSFLDDEDDDQHGDTTSSSDSSVDDSYKQFGDLLLNSSTPTSSGVVDPYRNISESDPQSAGDQDMSKSFDFLNIQESMNTEMSGSFGLEQEQTLDTSDTMETSQHVFSMNSSMNSWELISENSENNVSLEKDVKDSNNIPNIANVDLLGLGTDSSFQFSSNIPENPKDNESNDFTDLLGGELSSNFQGESFTNQNSDLLNFQPQSNSNTAEKDKTENTDVSWDVLHGDTEA